TEVRTFPGRAAVGVFPGRAGRACRYPLPVSSTSDRS
ncbi:MAG: hypothetical protein JWO49_3008, partial [Arthrobacter sp.]|nr:hypothetical protein [Arthrobacter sp.]